MAKRDKKVKKPAAHLAPPAEVTASVSGGNLVVSWVAVEGATKYGVSIDGAYDTEGDGELETVHEYDVEVSASPATIPMSTFEVPVDADDDGVDDGVVSPKELSVKVKGLNPGKGAGRQNHPYSVPVAVAL